MATALLAWTGLCVIVAVLGGIYIGSVDSDPLGTSAKLLAIMFLESFVVGAWFVVTVGAAAIWTVDRLERTTEEPNK